MADGFRVGHMYVKRGSEGTSMMLVLSARFDPGSSLGPTWTLLTVLAGTRVWEFHARNMSWCEVL